MIDKEALAKAKKLRKKGKITSEEYHRIYSRFKSSQSALKRKVMTASGKVVKERLR